MSNNLILRNPEIEKPRKKGQTQKPKKDKKDYTNVDHTEKKFRDDIIEQSYISISPKYLVRFTQLEDKNGNAVRISDKSKVTFESNFKDNDTYGILSNSAQRQMQKALTLMLYANRTLNGKIIEYNNITFVTLTLPSKQVHTDTEIKEFALNQFLIELNTWFRKGDEREAKANMPKKREFVYIWKAERQENGNIHFHIVMNRTINWTVIQYKWNRILNRGTVKGCENPFNYVDTYNNRMENLYKSGFVYDPETKSSYDKQRKAYLKQMRKSPSKRWKRPNSIDIHKLKEIRNIEKYLSKYISKNDGEKNELIEQLRDSKKYIEETLSKTELYTDRFNEYCQSVEQISNGDFSELLEQKRLEFIKDLEKLTVNKIEGRLWFLSAKLSAQMKKNCTVADNEISSILKDVYEYCHKNNKIKQLDYCDIILLSLDELAALGFGEIKRIFDKYLII